MSGDDGVTIIDQQLNALRLFNEWIDRSKVSGKPPQRVSIIAHSSGAHLVALFDKRFGWSNSVNHLVLLDSAYVLKESYADSSGYEVETKSLSLAHRAFIR